MKCPLEERHNASCIWDGLLDGGRVRSWREAQMANPNGHTRVCPTRIDGGAALFAHRVTLDQCQDRQRGRYHKCFTCVYNNAYVAIHGLPQPTQPERAPVENEEVSVPDRTPVKIS